MGRRGKRRQHLLGRHFGKLLVIEEPQDSNKVLCKCDCGNEKWVARGNLINGHTKSCGCMRRTSHKARLQNIVGQRYGKLVVLEELGDNKVRCRCDCGNETVVSKGALKRGQIVSCGCRRRILASYMVGGVKSKYTTEYMLKHKFGMLQPIHAMENGLKYLCICDCGKAKIVRRNDLTSGNVSSCGCKRTNARSAVGRRNGHLVIIKELGGNKVLCRCDCGNEVALRKSNALAKTRKYCSRTCPLQKEDREAKKEENKNE